MVTIRWMMVAMKLNIHSFYGQFHRMSKVQGWFHHQTWVLRLTCYCWEKFILFISVFYSAMLCLRVGEANYFHSLVIPTHNCENGNLSKGWSLMHVFWNVELFDYLTLRRMKRYRKQWQNNFFFRLNFLSILNISHNDFNLVSHIETHLRTLIFPFFLCWFFFLHLSFRI